MKRFAALSPLLTPLAAIALAIALLAANPFIWVNAALASVFQAGPKEAKIERLYQDPSTADLSTGERPAEALASLASAWASHPVADRTVLIGNSQMLSIVLAPGESPVDGLRTYPDLLGEQYLPWASRREAHYRLAAGNISYMEALWYVEYLLTVPELRPSHLILQLNYESMRKLGIRDGMLGLLAHPPFLAAVTRIAASAEPHSAVFAQALARWRSAGPAAEPRKRKPSAQTAADLAETRSRAALASFAPWDSRHSVKREFLTSLYLLRVHLLRIKPTTRRPLSGATLTMSSSSLDAIARACAAHGIRLSVFNAPQNPATPLYASERDRKTYSAILDRFRQVHHVPVYDFENAIPARCWGRWIDGSDPIHFGRAGHERMAHLFLSSGILSETRHAVQ
jgi:hypothetical protein